jgi:hypothetical protein
VTIPTPFIGGTGGQQADRPDKKEMAPPFFTEDEAAAAGEEPQGEPEAKEPAEALADLDLAEEFEVEPDELAPVEPVEEISELALDDFADAKAVEPQEEPFEQVSGTSELEPQIEAEPALEAAAASDGPGFGMDDGGFPDFLEGPDAAAPDAPASPPIEIEAPPEKEVPTAPPAEEPTALEEADELLYDPVEPPFTVDQITAMAARLMTGEYGDWIMQLKDDLGPVADETAVLGAFAAGYLAAMADMEKE